MPSKTKAAAVDAATNGPGDYGADEIVKLEGLEPVRLRPGMYVGGTDSKSLLHCVWEIVDNAVDEALAGHATEIRVTVGEDQVVEVIDNGRGIPVGINQKTGQSALELVFEELHAGGKFGGGGYKVSGGLHGVGASVTNALSHWLEAEVKRDGFVWTARWKQGKRDKPVSKGRPLKKGESTGTTVRWLYDDTIFDRDVHYVYSLIEQRLREKSYLVRGLKFALNVPGKPEQVFQSKTGIAEYVKALASENKPVHKDPIFLVHEGVEVKLDDDTTTEIPVEVALQWTNEDDEHIFSFANIVSTPNGGTPVAGLKNALTRAMNLYAKEQGKFKKDNESFEGRDIFDGLFAAVSVKIENPKFQGQTKDALLNAEARTAVQTFVYSTFGDWLNDKRNATEAKRILDRCIEAREIRIAKGKISKKIKNEANSIFTDSNLPGKLKDCVNPTGPIDERELFIVEGDSAMGTAKDARDNRFQAVLPIRGKILNVLEATKGKEFENAEVEGILVALGGRVDAVGKRVVATLEPDQRRYGRLIILTDADDDGSHIAMLLLTMFWKVFPQLVREGRIFLAKPPLFKINLDAKGEKYVYAWSEEEREALVKKHKRSTEDTTRFKGLGEMNAPDLAETSFDVETRQLLQVTVEDAAEAQETLNLLMGGSRAAGRRAWLEDTGFKTEAM